MFNSIKVISTCYTCSLFWLKIAIGGLAPCALGTEQLPTMQPSVNPLKKVAAKNPPKGGPRNPKKKPAVEEQPRKKNPVKCDGCDIKAKDCTQEPINNAMNFCFEPWLS